MDCRPELRSALCGGNSLRLDQALTLVWTPALLLYAMSSMDFYPPKTIDPGTLGFSNEPAR